jgi:tetratricopeptide (TPR) repeat protein
MGGAFVALADDTSAIMFNPAGLGQIGRTEFAAAYDKLYAGLDDGNLGRGFVSYVHPSRYYGAFALNLAMLHTSLYKETTATFGYGKSFGGSTYLGLNVKGLFVSFEENDYTRIDPLFDNDNTSTNDLALDLGMLYKLTDNLSFGLAALNVNEPNMALGEADTDAKVPFTLQTGIALKLGHLASTIDLTYRNKELRDEQDINLHVGIESWLADRNIALRAGVNSHDMAVGASYVFSRGKSVEAQLDYAFRYPLVFKEDAISDIYGSHQFSLDIRFGGFAAAPEAIAEREGEAPAEPDTQSELDGLIRKAMEYKKEGKYEEGISLCNEILKVESGEALAEYQVEAHMQMGGMLTRLERYDEALDSFQSAAKMAPQDPRTHYELGVFYKQHGDRTGNKSWYNKAIIEFERTRMIDPKFEDVSAELARLYKKR